MNIHDFVEKMKDQFATEVESYIKTLIEESIVDISIKNNIDQIVLKDTIDRTMTSSKKKCIMKTTLGHACKYTAIEGGDMCVRHHNLDMKNKGVLNESDPRKKQRVL